ncbi:MAG: von Willebrand factor type A domain-containing protein [Oscillospiraceae bacterium]|nr:von Willebrand factor type A domain-containing protein [Oscillospiraceae bacterium]
MRRRFCTFLAAVALLATSTGTIALKDIAASARYTDVQADTPHRAAIEYLTAEGILEGDGGGAFRPDAEITRAEFCKLAVAVFGTGEPDVPSQEAPAFADVDAHWAKEYIEAAASMGLVNGLGDGRFGPDEKITCEQAITIVVRAVRGSLKAYPLDYLTYAMNEGISSGVPAITGRHITRGEVAQIIYNVLERRDFEELERIYYEAASNDDSREGNAAPQYMPQTSGETYLLEEAAPLSILDGGSGAGLYYESDVYPGGMYYGYHNTEEYLASGENSFHSPLTSPLSTFSLDVNTASYSLIRSSLQRGLKPDSGAVKIEEMINYFRYDLERPAGDDPFKVTTEMQPCPWNEDHYLAMIALQGYDIDKEDLPPCNLVFLIDVSGSMLPANRLPLVQRSMCLLVDELREQDTVTIVVYANRTGTMLEATSGSEKETIKRAVYGLRAGGSTNGAGGIQLAYEEARKNFIEGGNNRVILCTDGDFNVGVSSVSGLEELIVEQREGGIFLSVLGYGMGNIKDNKMETLAMHGNGNYAYIDNLREAKKVLVDDMTSTIFTIASDVKLQVEFNPETVEAYRLIGYEKRLLEAEDFADDAKDAGEMGAGHSMIAFYEIIPSGAGEVESKELTYQTAQTSGSGEFMRVELRYKVPGSDSSVLMDPVVVAGLSDAQPSEVFNFASAVVEWGLLLGDSAYKGDASFDSVIARAFDNIGGDAFGYRAEFVQLVDLSRFV